MNQTELAFTSALQQAKMIRQGEVSPLELTKLYLDRIATYDPLWGSFFHVATEQALLSAQAKTELFAKTLDKSSLPPFFGVPTAIKDLNPVAGMPCSYGSAVLKTHLPSYDEETVVRLKEAGFVLLGKTAASELGTLPYAESAGFPPTRNPWNPDYTSGGSSSGAGAAVAGGLCSIAQGADGGGSIRCPASCCGLVGLKPARGRVSFAPVGDYQNGIATNGSIARTVADVAGMLDVMAGYTTGDPYWLPDPEIPFLQAVGQSPNSLRIAFSSRIPPLVEAVPLYREMITTVAHRLQGLGHILIEDCFDVSGLVEPFKRIWAAGSITSSIPFEALSPINQWLGGVAGSAGDYLKAVYQMQAIARRFVAFMDNYDVLLLPVYTHPPIRVGEWAELSPEAVVDRIVNWIAPCPPVNASGLPAIALPSGLLDDNGLPIGFQIIGKPADELTLLRLAGQIELAYPWENLQTMYP